MPKISKRQRILNEIDEALKMAFMDQILRDTDSDSDTSSSNSDSDSTDSNNSKSEDENIQTLGTLYFLVSDNRFLNQRWILAKSKDFVLNYFLDQPDDQFRQITRVTRPLFYHIIELIRFDPIFHNVSTCDQAPVHWQLACALDRLGNEGQGVSHARSKFLWGIGQGTVHLYTQRVVKALWGLRELFIRWPSVEERLQTSRRMEAKGFKNCVGFVDGTTFPLHKKPAVYGNIYMDRKKRYSVNGQVVCDDQRRIVHFMTGQPGSVGDNRVFSKSPLAREPHLAFSANQYLLADSAYAASSTVIPTYKENSRDDNTDQEEPRKIELFNTFLAKARVVNEHTIGVLKGRWTSLKGLRIDLHEREDITTLIRQVVACVVLHNICLNSDPWEVEELEDPSEDDEDEGVVDGRRVRRLSPGMRRRWEVRRACLAFHGLD